MVASDATSIQYQLTIRGFTANDKQVRVEIQPGALKDNSGNQNIVSDRFIAFNTLATSSNTSFLGKIDPSSITSLKFEVNSNATFQDGDIPVAAQGDNSIWARVSGGNVTIYSADEINANKDSSYLFANIDCTISGIGVVLSVSS